IICNVIFVIGMRLELMQRDSGIPVDELVYVDVASLLDSRDPHTTINEDKAALLSIPGVKSVTAPNQVPYGDMAWGMSLAPDPDNPTRQTPASAYMDDGDLLATLGLHGQEGRSFLPEEYSDTNGIGSVPAILVTRSLAQQL